MTYRGKAYLIPCERGGLNHDKNIDAAIAAYRWGKTLVCGKENFTNTMAMIISKKLDMMPSELIRRIGRFYWESLTDDEIKGINNFLKS